MAAGARPLAAQSSDWQSHDRTSMNVVDDSTAQAGQLPPVPPPHLADTRIALRNEDVLSFRPLAVCGT